MIVLQFASYSPLELELIKYIGRSKIGNMYLLDMSITQKDHPLFQNIPISNMTPSLFDNGNIIQGINAITTYVTDKYGYTPLPWETDDNNH